MKLILVLSDLHIGSGHHKGRVNIYDDFREDSRFEQLLHRYSSGRYADAEVHLVLNGDIFDLLKVTVNGTFPEAISERIALMKLEQCLEGHPRVTRALAAFVSHPKRRLTYQPGNHDMEFFFPGVQQMFCRALTGEDTHPRVQFVKEEPSFTLEDGIQFHHGQQFEAIHAFDFKKLFLSRKGGEPILNLPWGSLFVLQVVNRMMQERPYLDKVMPFWPLFAGGIVFDTQFTLKLIASSVYYYGRARVNPVWWQKRPFEKLSKFLRTELGFFERLDHYAKKMLAGPELNAVFMGHTHCEMVRTYPRNKIYVNTGTWQPMINLKLTNLGQNIALHYGLVEYSRSGERRVSLMRWHGQRPVTEEVIF
jgi:UDP-2,3-diacylglucosamine pyrophosphatase LpxH